MERALYLLAKEDLRIHASEFKRLEENVIRALNLNINIPTADQFADLVLHLFKISYESVRITQ